VLLNLKGQQKAFNAARKTTKTITSIMTDNKNLKAVA